MKHFIKFILAKVLVILGFSSCSYIDPAAEYGTPYAEFEIKGTVKNEQNEPVKGIQVSVITDEYAPYQPTYTDENGQYEIDGNIIFIGIVEGVRFEDVDNELNGEYDSSEVMGEDFVLNKISDGEGWDDGDYEATVDVTLKEKSNE